LENDKREAEKQDELVFATKVLRETVEVKAGRKRADSPRSVGEDVIDDQLERPGLEQVQRDPAKRQDDANNRLGQKRPVILKSSPIDRHGEI
jgi:hypothetical protein